MTMAKYISKFKMLDQVGNTVVAEIRDNDAQSRVDAHDIDIANINESITDIKEDINTNIKPYLVKWNLLNNGSLRLNTLSWNCAHINFNTVEHVTYEGEKYLHIKLNEGSNFFYIRQNCNLVYGNDYTVSINLFSLGTKTDNSACGIRIELQGTDDKGEERTLVYDTNYYETKKKNVFITLSHEEYEKTLTTITDCYVYLFIRDYTGDIYANNFKLEEGNKATEYSASYQDIYSLENKTVYTKNTENLTLL
jgi:hypothetical protein